MDDKTMLELAARAAGIVAPFDDKWGGMLIPFTVHESDAGLDYWNPLTSDGDALRLAVKLGMDMDVWLGAMQTIVVFGGASDPKSTTENHETDPYAATRRAITRAAAEIGKAMGRG